MAIQKAKGQRDLMDFPANWDGAIGPSILWHNRYMQHEPNAYCWCDPEIIEDDEGPDFTIRHNDFQ